MKNCFVGFYGLTRSLSNTIDSLKRNIFQPLIDNDYLIDIGMHTYNLEKLYNVRSNEINIKLDTNEWKLLSPEYISITSQEHCDIELINIYNRSKENGDAWNDNYASLLNMLRQLYSLNILISKIPNKNYDMLIIIRPDIYYWNKLNIRYIESYIDNKTIFIPDYGHYKNGLNDRGAIGLLSSITKWGKRIRLILKYNKKLHSEQFNKYVLYKYNLNIRYINERIVKTS